LHKLLKRQLKKATREDGQVDVDRLMGLVDSAYDEADKERRLTQRSFGEMSQETQELTRTGAEHASSPNARTFGHAGPSPS